MERRAKEDKEIKNSESREICLDETTLHQVSNNRDEEDADETPAEETKE